MIQGSDFIVDAESGTGGGETFFDATRSAAGHWSEGIFPRFATASISLNSSSTLVEGTWNWKVANDLNRLDIAQISWRSSSLRHDEIAFEYLQLSL